MDRKKKERVNLRKRLMPSGNTSLYLDVFTKEGRKYEYLKLYLVPEHTRADKEQNRQTMQLAEAIREQRQGDTDRNLKLKIKNNAKSSTNPCRHPDAWLMLQRRRGI